MFGSPTKAVRTRGSGEAGFGLVEVLVSLSLLSVFMAMVTAGIITMYRAATTTESISRSQSQLHVAFQRLEKTIRYAAEISEPGQVGVNWYVEYRQLKANGATCGQLRLLVGRRVLQQREWTEGATPGSFATLASNVSSTRPFDLMPGEPTTEAVGANQFQRLRISVTTGSGLGGAGGVKTLSVSFNALNAARANAGAAACSQQGRANP